MSTTWQTTLYAVDHDMGLHKDDHPYSFASAGMGEVTGHEPSPFAGFDMSSPTAYPLPIEHRQSISSASSPFSTTMDLDGWSTVASSETAGSDPAEGLAEGEVEPSACMNGGASASKPPGGLSLSIDPSLFRPKQRQDPATTHDHSDDDEDDNMLTARPLGKLPTMPTPSKPRGKNNSPKKTSHARKQNPDHIPRPRNAFILFRKHVVDSKLIPASVEVRHQNVSIITAKMWAEASPEQKAHFNELAKIEKEEHMKKYPGYRYQPVYRRTNVIRRRVRKDEAEEEKCQSVADLLMKGKKGEELEEEIRERMQKEPPTKAKKDRAAPATKSPSGAVALSKGALRALRAKARQEEQQSLEWSALSRSTSVARSVSAASEYEYDPRPHRPQQLQQQQIQHQRSTPAPFHPMPDLSRRGSVFSEISAASGFAAQHQHQNQPQPLSLFGGAAEEFFDTQPQTATWVGQQQLAQQQQQQYAYPQSMGHPLDQMQTYHYPQPGSIMPSYANGWNAPLPFDAGPAPQPLPLEQYGSGAFTDSGYHGVQGTQAADQGLSETTASTSPPHPLRSDATSADFMFAGYTNDLVSPTGGMFRAAAAGAAPASARWDRTTHQSAPDNASGGDMPFDSFGIDMGMGGLDFGEPFLDDFGAALAQAEEIRGW